jgi:predicted transposase/invertase (TIGR01784 family)
MAKPKTSVPRKKALKVKDLGVYINLLTDFGFKRAFGIKEVMIKFLNSVLDIEGSIVDLRYDNPEKLGMSQFDRKAVYDLYCITDNDEHIIVEIQNAPQVYFKERTIVYTSRLINLLSEKGKDWNFKLPKVYSINILDFSFQEASKPLSAVGEIKKPDKNKYVSRVLLIDIDTGEVFYEKLTLVYIELPNFTKELEDVKTAFEQLIFIIKHLHELNDIPEKLRNDEIFEKIFEIAKIARMTKEEVTNYLKDLNNMNIVRNEIRTLKEFISERDNIIAQKDNALSQMGNALAQKDNALQQANARIAEYERMAKLNKTSFGLQ